VALAGVWEALLAAQGLTAAQVLLTLGDLEDRRRYLNVAATIARLLDLGAVPVLNENDTVATTEIRFGDNDRLAARAAQAAGASGVILLSDVDGLYTANPANDPTAQRLPVVKALTPEIMAMATGETRSGMGSGGMAAKLLAARMAGAAGIALAICDGRVERPLTRFATHCGGTLFLPPRAAKGRKAWLAGRITVAGALVVDAGAAVALKRGASLLAAGVRGVDGRFKRGDVVAIMGSEGELLGRGLAGYDVEDAFKIMGLRNEAQGLVLGYAPRAALVHADHLVLI
jgi:glutamate 5-kinase